MQCITDANFWIDLFEGTLLDRVFSLDLEWIITDVVLHEVMEEGRMDASLILDYGARCETLPGDLVDQITLLAERYAAPSPQDLSALVLAVSQNLVLVTGDKALREAAESEGVEVHGTLWVLDKLVDGDVIQPAFAAECLERMVASDRRLPAHEVSRRLSRWRSS